MPDNLTSEQRKRCMSSVRNRNTDIEKCVRSELHRRGLRFRKHVRQLHGSPDVVFPTARVAVFINGDFWHGYRFNRLQPKLSHFWAEKIAKNRQRDLQSYLSLRRSGWMVIRVWQHDVKRDSNAVADRIERAVRRRQSLFSRDPKITSHR